MQERKKKRLESVLRDILTKFLEAELDVPNGIFVSVSRIEIRESGSMAKAVVSVYPATGVHDIEKKLKKMEYRAKTYIGSQLSLKYIPDIRFEIDIGEKMREKIESILENK
ncbi:ribosome-binding factor A [Patescibacteria group bacterium]